MKASLIIATLAIAASVSAQAPSDSDLATQWCQVYTATCTQASNTVCGANFVSKANICKSVVFTNGKCADFTTACGCANAAGVVKNLSEQVLDNTFAAKKGQCANLPRTRVPVNGTTGPTVTSTGASPSNTTSPEKGNSAGKAATNALLAVAAAIAAAALAL